MLSLSSLLNPISTSESRWISLPSSSPSYYSHLSPNESPRPSGQQSSAKSKMSKDGAVFFKGKVMGTVMFPPFENLDPESVREVQKYKVFPLGEIVKYPRHIPYNSEKKSFLEKTGRHSFEGRIAIYIRCIADKTISFPIHIPTSRRRKRTHGNVGLQYRACPYYAFLQVLQLLEG